MKNRLFILTFLLMISIASTANAALKDRLIPISSGKENIAVDRFIIGTQDRYIATIVRDLTEETAADLGDTMRDMAILYGNKDLVLIEKIILDKNEKRLSLVDRYMALSSDLMARLSSEPTINSDLIKAEPGTFGGLLWEKIAGPDGLGKKILSDEPAPVELKKDDKNPVDAKRYAPMSKGEAGGIFLDKSSIKKTEEGCSASILEAFDYDAEVHFGGLAMQYTNQPYVDASYAVSTYEYSFEQLAHRKVRFTKFSHDGKIIYSIKNPNLEWIKAEEDPMVPLAMLVLRANLPEDVIKLMPKTIESFDEFMKNSTEEFAKEKEKQSNEQPKEKAK